VGRFFKGELGGGPRPPSSNSTLRDNAAQGWLGVAGSGAAHAWVESNTGTRSTTVEALVRFCSMKRGRRTDARRLRRKWVTGTRRVRREVFFGPQTPKAAGE
jgi:hypothetical protein